MTAQDITRREKLRSLRRVARYRPFFTVFIVGFSLFVTVLEGVGLTFLFPIIEAARSSGRAPTGADGVGGAFLRAYELLGLPFTLESLMVGLAFVMVVRYTSTFLARWMAAKLTKEYERHLKTRAFELAMSGSISYYDEKGSDEILNAIITQTRYAGRVIRRTIQLLRELLLAGTYAAIAMVIAPTLTVATAVLLGGVTYLVRNVVEPGVTVGTTVARTNERLQGTVQATTQGIRDVKLFELTDDLRGDFHDAIDTYTDASVDVRRNKVAIRSFYQLTVVLTLFGLIYAAINVSTLSVSALGVFLFAMFRLASQVSSLNSTMYAIETGLPHLVRTHRFVDRLAGHQEPNGGSRPVPDRITDIEFDDVSFGYDDEPVLRDVSFRVERGEFVGLVGGSGAGKSTIVSLLARLYDPDDGEIRANQIPIDEFDVSEWRRSLAVVRQDPYIFDETLRYNLTLGRDVSDDAVERVSAAACVDEFRDDLPDGYRTELGDDGVKLSGGQRQRVALARALLTDAEVLLLDEATSDLDSNLEREIHRTIESLDGNRTVVAIAHRLSTVTDADRIYTLEDGRIAETGSHRELVANDGLYSELHSIQTTEAE